MADLSAAARSAIVAFANMADPKDQRLAHQLVEMTTGALEAPAGYRFITDYSSMRLAVVIEDRVVIAYRRGTSTAAWKLPRWSRDDLKNRPMLEAWAASKSRARDSITVTVKREPTPVVTAKEDGASLLAAVVAEPENLEARRVYADWLIEQGDVRGELIHAECALEAEGLSRMQRTSLEERRREILVRYKPWLEASLMPYVESAERRYGLVEAIAIEGKRLPAHAARLFGEHPIHRLRVFVKDGAELARITPLPQLRRVTDLEIVARASPKNPGATLGLAALSRTDLFSSVRRLAFDGVRDSASAWQKLLGEMRAPVLTALAIEYFVPPKIYELLGDAATLPTVRDLAIYCPIHGDGARSAATRLAAHARSHNGVHSTPSSCKRGMATRMQLHCASSRNRDRSSSSASITARSPSRPSRRSATGTGSSASSSVRIRRRSRSSSS